MLGLEHVVGLSSKQRANGAVPGSHEERALSTCQHHWRNGQRPVGLELDSDQHDQLLRILCAGGDRPQLREARAQGVKFAQRQLRRGAIRQAERRSVVEGLAGGCEPRRVSLVEQRRHLFGIELGRRWGGLLGRGWRLGVGLLWLGFLGLVLRQRVRDWIRRRLGLLFLRFRFGGLGFRGRRRLVRGFYLLLFHHFRGGVLNRLCLCDLFDQGFCRIGFRRALGASGNVGEFGGGHQIDRQTLVRHRERLCCERPHAPQQYGGMPDRRYGIGRPHSL